MTAQQIKDALRKKTVQLQAAMDAELPHEDLVKIYKELKELQYQLTFAELPSDSTKKKETA